MQIRASVYRIFFYSGHYLFRALGVYARHWNISENGPNGDCKPGYSGHYKRPPGRRLTFIVATICFQYWWRALVASIVATVDCDGTRTETHILRPGRRPRPKLVTVATIKSFIVATICFQHSGDHWPLSDRRRGSNCGHNWHSPNVIVAISGPAGGAPRDASDSGHCISRSGEGGDDW